MPTHADHSATPARASTREVAIVMEAASSFSRGVLTGVSQWMTRHSGWLVTINDWQREAPLPGWLLRWSGDGMICGLPEKAVPRPWRGGRRPVVHVRGRLTAEPLPGIYPDDDAAVRMAVSHLVDRGVRQFGVCPAGCDTAGRCESIVRHAQAAGCVVDVFAAPRCGVRPRPAGEPARHAIAAWLASLRKPVGVIAADDVQALQILEACREQGFAVPDEVAVAAIGDDDAVCELATPALTSVTHDRVRIGRQAARLLDEAMRAGRAPSAVVLVPPVGITVRRSSDVLAVDDADVRRALKLIKARGCADLSAADVATTVGVPRRMLDRKFHLVLGRTIHDELQLTKISEAKRLLAETDHKLLVVSVRAGFTHAAQLCNVFRSAVGMSPMQYRRAARPCRELRGSGAPARRR
jgi:LacI family transcriptional regulator